VLCIHRHRHNRNYQVYSYTSSVPYTRRYLSCTRLYLQNMSSSFLSIKIEDFGSKKVSVHSSLLFFTFARFHSLSLHFPSHCLPSFCPSLTCFPHPHLLHPLTLFLFPPFAFSTPSSFCLFLSLNEVAVGVTIVLVFSSLINA